MPDTKECAAGWRRTWIQKSNMHVDGKSDGRAVPTKCPKTKAEIRVAEGMKGSRLAKEEHEQTTASQTQSGVTRLSGLRGVREAERGTSGYGSRALLHHRFGCTAGEQPSTLEARRGSGVDGVTWTEYETGLSER